MIVESEIKNKRDKYLDTIKDTHMIGTEIFYIFCVYCVTMIGLLWLLLEQVYGLIVAPQENNESHNDSSSSDKNQNLDDSRETQCTNPSLVPFCKINPHLKCAFNSENRILKKAINRKFKYTPLLKRCAERGIASSTTSTFKINENSPNVAVIAKIPSKTEVLDSLIFPIEETLVTDTNIICGLDSEKGCCAIVPYTYECFNSNHSTDGKIRIFSLQKTADCCMGQLRIDYEMVIPNCLQLETLGTLEIQSFRTVPYRNRHTTSVITCKLQSTNTFPKIKIKELDSDYGVIPEKMFEINSSEDIFLTATINASRKKGRKQKLFRHTNYSEKLTFSPTQCHGRLMSFMNRNRGYTQSKLMLEIEKELRPIKEQIKELQRSMTNVNVINCRSKKGVKNGYISQIFTRLHEEGCSDLDTEDGPTRLSPLAEMYIKLSRY